MLSIHTNHIYIHKATKLFLFPDDFRGKKPTTQYYKVSCTWVTYDFIIHLLLRTDVLNVHICLWILFFPWTVVNSAGQHSSNPTLWWSQHAVQVKAWKLSDHGWIFEYIYIWQFFIGFRKMNPGFSFRKRSIFVEIVCLIFPPQSKTQDCSEAETERLTRRSPW